MSPRQPNSLSIALALSLTLGASVVAQTVTPVPTSAPSTEPVIELSPFVTTETSNTGWVATETLAGTRLRTDLKDVPNQIETLTKDFMTDLGVTDMNQALIYTANVENANDYMRATPGQQVINPEMGGRVRGIGSGTLSRNFFQVSNPTDNFNLERATIASGPNAILFGLGSGAGILDATPAQALLNRNKYGFSLQYDSEYSKRGTIDANVVVLKDKLAVRVMGLSKTEYTHKQPNHDRDDRLYAAVTFKPFKNTNLILEGEKDNRSWNIASRVAPVDAVTPWLNANRIPNSGYSVASPAFDNRDTVAIPAANLIFGQAAQNAVLVENGSVPLMNWRNSAVVKAPTTLPGVDPTFDASVDRSILDPNLFPLDVNIVGESRTNHMGGNTKTAMLEQRLARNLFVEVAYNYEKYFSKRIYAGGQQPSNNAVLRIDPNQFLPGTTTPNPNFGKFYTQGTSSNNLRFQTNEDARANASYEFDFNRDVSRGPSWIKWLGRHRLSGMFTTSTQKALDSQDNNRRILDEPVIAGLTLTPKTTGGLGKQCDAHATGAPLLQHALRSIPHGLLDGGRGNAPRFQRSALQALQLRHAAARGRRQAPRAQHAGER